MLRGYRLFILAIGLVLCGAEKPKEQAQGQPRTSQTEQTVAPLYAPYAGYNPDPCYQAKNHDTADLCAQWRAAIAAEKAAHEARRSTNWAIVATLLSSATIIGLIVSLYQTSGALTEARRGNRLNMSFERRARRESNRAAKDQERALQIAEGQFLLSEKSAKAQLRSYLVVDRIVPFQTTGDTFSAKVSVKNVGQTPARIRDAKAIMWISEVQTVNPLKDGVPPEKYYHFIDLLAQGASNEILAICADASLAGKLNETDKADIFVYGRIEFTDVFGEEHWMTFASCPAGWGYADDTKFRPCIYGNDSD